MKSIRTTLMNAALKGRDMAPEQIMAAMYGKMGGMFGKMQGNIGATVASIQTPRPPEMPKPMVAGIDLLKLL